MDWTDLNRLRGMTPRQRRLLDADARYEGTQYVGLPHWSIYLGPDGQPLCGEDKAPTLLAGVIREKVDTVLRLLIGEGRFPSIEVSGTDGATFVNRLDDDGGLRAAVRKPVRDVLNKGCGVLAFSLLDTGEIEIHRMAPEWCEPVLVCKAARGQARRIREDVEQTIAAAPDGDPAHEIVLADPVDGDWLAVPERARSHDLVWLRYEYMSHDEATLTEGHREDDCVRHRTDYTPTQVIEYEPMVVASSATSGAAWRVARVLTHDFGFVPASWLRPADADDGEIDGPSLQSAQLVSVADAADRMLTRKDESASVVSSPKAYTIDLQDLVADYNAEADRPTGWRATSKEVLAFQSRPEKQGQIGLLEPSGEGPKIAREHLQDLDARAERITGIITHDPAQAEGVLSGTALERRMEPTIAVVNRERPAIALWLANFVGKIAAATRGVTLLPKVTIQWPDVVAKTSDDRKAIVDGLSAATGNATLISQESAVRLAAAAFEIDDVEGELARVTADAEGAMQRAREALARRPKPAPEPEPERKSEEA